MPGPLGRVARLAANRTVQPSNRRSAAVLPINSSTVRLARDDRSTLLPAGGYLTRAFSGLNTPEEQQWGERNHLTAPLFFSHNLADVFPRELYQQHPEFFPLIAGKRLDPPSGPVFWQPDLGREDVARYAADHSKRYFAEHPNAETFSLGVNDGLNFGESPETIALLRGAAAAAGVSERQSTGRSDLQRRSTAQPIGHGSDTSNDEVFERPRLRHPDTPNIRDSVTPKLRSTGIRYFRGRPDFSPLVFTFMNRSAVDLARTYPDKYLGCLAYYWCENTPPFAVDPHVLPFLTADRTQSYDPAFVREEFGLQSRWAAALRAGSAVEKSNRPTTSDLQFDSSTVRQSGSRSTFRPFDSGNRRAQGEPPPRLGLYDYLDGFGFLIPRVPINAFAEHIRHAYEAGFTDYFGEASRNWGLDGPMPWVIAQLLQDPEQDVDKLLDTYYTAYFQAAAEPMRRFFSRCEEQWMQQPGPSYWLKHYRNTSQAALFPSAVCLELRSLLTQAAAQANSEVVRQRVAFVSDAFGVTERFVAMCEARDALTTLILHHQLSGAEGEHLVADYHQKRRTFFRYSHDLTERCPLAFAPISYGDWLRDDPSFAAREELAAARNRTVEQSNSLIGSDLPFDRSTVRPAHAREELSSEKLNYLSFSASQNFSVSRRIGKELLQNGEFAGALTPGRMIAGLHYGIDLPAPWQSRVEPTERGLAVLVDSRTVEQSNSPIASDLLFDTSTVRQRTRSRFLRLEAQESAIVFTWAPAKPGRTYVVSAWTRAQVGPSDIVELVIGWLDVKNERIGTPIGIRLPEGSWPDWVQLIQGAKAPPHAAWVGIQFVVEHQVGSDWAEARDFSIGEIAESSSD